MCHQSVGLIARHVEAAGIPTLSMSSAYSITRAVNPPRAVFLDFPLGRTSGKPGDTTLKRRIMLDTFAAFAAIDAPGTIVTLPYAWADDDAWKERAMHGATGPGESPGGRDERAERTDTPQYELDDDERAAAEAGTCATCVWLEHD